MVAIAENSPDGPLKKQKTRVNYALAATLVTAGANLQDIYEQCGAKNVNVLRVGLAKRGVTKRYANSLPMPDARATSNAVRVAAVAADMLRDNLGEQLGAAVSALGAKRIKYSDLANDGQGHAAVLKTLAETHKTLYGGAEMNVLVFGVDSMNDRPGSQQISQASEQNSQGVIDVGPGE